MITYTLDSRRRFPPSLHGGGRPDLNATAKRGLSSEGDVVSNKRQAVSNVPCDNDQSYVGSEKVEAWRLSTRDYDSRQHPRRNPSVEMRPASDRDKAMGNMDDMTKCSDRNAEELQCEPQCSTEIFVAPPSLALPFSSAAIFEEVCGHIPRGVTTSEIQFAHSSSHGKTVGKKSVCNFCYRHSLACNNSRPQCENSVAFGQACVRLLCDKNLFRALCWRQNCLRVHFEDILEWFSRWEPEWSGLLLFTDGDILSKGETTREKRPRNRLGVHTDGLQRAFMVGSNHRRLAINLMREHCGIQKRWSTADRPFLFWDWAGIDSRAKWLGAFGEFLTWARPLLDEAFTMYERPRNLGQSSGARIDWRIEEWRWAYKIIAAPDAPPAESRQSGSMGLERIGPRASLVYAQTDGATSSGQHALAATGSRQDRATGRSSIATLADASLKASDSVSQISTPSGVDEKPAKVDIDTTFKSGTQSQQTSTVAKPPKGPRGWLASMLMG
ncbi:hypothetical protein LTS10_002547 [Elasticomyces elasticus]|nr:hypothetical protein LTS10_002547 [Elasticomyces elasticus]